MTVFNSVSCHQRLVRNQHRAKFCIFSQSTEIFSLTLFETLGSFESSDRNLLQSGLPSTIIEFRRTRKSRITQEHELHCRIEFVAGFSNSVHSLTLTSACPGTLKLRFHLLVLACASSSTGINAEVRVPRTIGHQFPRLCTAIVSVESLFFWFAE